MDKDTRNRIQRATQAARVLLEREIAEQLEGIFDIRLDGTIAPEPGSHLDLAQRVVRTKIVAAVGHFRSGGSTAAQAVAAYQREAAFTMLNRFVALKMLEARDLLQECVSRGDESSGSKEFTGLAPGLIHLSDRGYRIYIESLFDEIGREVGILFDRRDPASLLWPRRQALIDLLAILNASDLTSIWAEDESIGWVYQYFNSDGDRQRARYDAKGKPKAPQDSYELAVRNQFFTPRYVVQFLTENTLGRIWFAMQGESTRLPDLCRYLALDGAELTSRPKKDPRDLHILDPACGSGHFLLYAFYLLLTIYQEAWEDPTAAPNAATGRTLRDDYADLDALRRALPALIVEHNLYGVEIDPRAAQISALALWMRAQRTWQEFGISAEQRPGIQRTHIVVAEPMPGDVGMVQSFSRDLQPPLLAELFEKMVAEMRLAGQLGTLLRVEDALAIEVRRAREQFIRQQHTVYLPGLEPQRVQDNADFTGIDDDGFFQEAEHRIFEALHRFAESASGSVGVRRRMFAEDAAQGIALLDIVRSRFDVVLMNPPFGACSSPAKPVFDRSYPRPKNDLYAAFVERGIQLLTHHGQLGAITSRTAFFLSSSQQWREEVLLKQAPPVVFADLGAGVLDSAMVETAAYCLEKGREASTAIFINALHCEDKATALSSSEPSGVSSRFYRDVQQFSKIPNTPLAYWAPESVFRVFQHMKPFSSRGYEALTGASTKDNPRFIRLKWEVPSTRIGSSREQTDSGRGWVLTTRGGRFARYYADIDSVIKWFNDGVEVKTFISQYYYEKGWGYRWNASLNGHHQYFASGLTWPLRGSTISVRIVPEGCIPGNAGKMAYAPESELLWLLAVANSSVFDTLVRLFAGKVAGVQYEVGLILKIPLPDLNNKDREALAALALRGWLLQRSLDRGSETSACLTMPALLQVEGRPLSDRTSAWGNRLQKTRAELRDIEAELQARCVALYGLDESDRDAMTEGFRSSIGMTEEPETESYGEEEAEEKDEEPADGAGLCRELVSWAVGVAFGRFDVRVAIGQRPLPPEPRPFDSLPVCSPGMLTGRDGLPPSSAPDGYPIRFPVDGVLVDDPGDARDMTAAVRTVFDVVFEQEADARWDEAADLMTTKEGDLRDWLTRNFFEHHIKLYSKSRRKAPIFWQLATGSSIYSVWLYAHRLTSDSLFRLLNDQVGPKLTHEERTLLGLIQDAGGHPAPSQRRAIAAQERLVEELRVMREEVARVAPLWNPDLNDGVVLTMAPLWRLVPQHGTWQRELKTAWDALCSGEYDWSAVAMHLWPERVVPKCVTDRSLAIAHDLENVFWIETSDGQWLSRGTDQTTIDRLIRERTSPAVKEALRSLLDAPSQAASSNGRGRSSSRRGSNAQSAAGEG